MTVISQETIQEQNSAAASLKPSGVPWLGDIPEGWDFPRIHSLFSEVNDRYVPDEDGELPLLSVSEYFGVAPRADKIGEDEILVRAESLDGYKKCQKGDIVVNIMLAWKNALGVSPCSGIVSPSYCVYRPRKEMDVRYFHHLFRTKRYGDVFRSVSTGIIDSRLRLYTDKFFSIHAPFPPLPEQRAIADFLDGRCAAIDAIVEEAKAGIEEYAKWKQSVVFEAVTKGLSPHAKMKNSGVEWIGVVPEEWKVSRVKNEFDCLDYLREPISAENRENKLGLYDYYGASGVIDKIDHYNVDDRVLLIGEDGANLRLRNLPLVYRASGKFWVNNHAHILKEKDGNDYGYFAYALEAGDYNPVITGSAQPKLSQSNLMAFPIAVPPLPEQRAIAAYLDEKCSSIDALIEEKKNLIEDLGTYKKSLIYETVTGKRRIAG